MKGFKGELTSADLERLAEVRAEWMSIGLSTEACDREAATAAVLRYYETAGLDAPPLVIWMDSPLGGVYACAALRSLTEKDQLRDQLRGQLWDQLRGQLGGQLGDQLWDQLRGQLRRQLGGQLGDQLWGQLWGQLGRQLWGQLGDQLGRQLWGQLGDQLWDQLRGQLRGQLWDQLVWGALSSWGDAYWAALYTEALRIAPLPRSERLDAMAMAIGTCGWWWPMRGAVVITDRPSVIARDNQARLHHESGPALLYRDGYTLHAWHGVRVPADLIETGWDTKRILTEKNQEVRRAAIERLGWDRFVTDAALALVHEDDDPANAGRRLGLYDVPEQIYGEPIRVLLCTNGTPERDGTVRRFGLTVPADINDAVHAAAWTYAMDRDTYAGLLRRT